MSQNAIDDEVEGGEEMLMVIRLGDGVHTVKDQSELYGEDGFSGSVIGFTVNPNGPTTGPRLVLVQGRTGSKLFPEAHLRKDFKV